MNSVAHMKISKTWGKRKWKRLPMLENYLCQPCSRKNFCLNPLNRLKVLKSCQHGRPWITRFVTWQVFMPSDQLNEDPMLISKKKKKKMFSLCNDTMRFWLQSCFWFFFLMLSFKKLASGCVGLVLLGFFLHVDNHNLWTCLSFFNIKSKLACCN